MLDPSNVDLPIKLAEVKNQVYQLEFELSEDIEVQMSEHRKNEYRLEGKSYTDHVNKQDPSGTGLCTHPGAVYPNASG